MSTEISYEVSNAPAPTKAGYWWWRPTKERNWITRQVMAMQTRRFDPPVKFLMADTGDGDCMTTHSGSVAARPTDAPFYGEWTGPIPPPK